MIYGEHKSQDSKAKIKSLYINIIFAHYLTKYFIFKIVKLHFFSFFLLYEMFPIFTFQKLTYSMFQKLHLILYSFTYHHHPQFTIILFCSHIIMLEKNKWTKNEIFPWILQKRNIHCLCFNFEPPNPAEIKTALCCFV